MPGELTEQCLRPRPGLGVHTQGAHPGLGVHTWPVQRGGLGGAADVGSSPQVAVGP